jgi:hypothetical protein
MFGIKDRYHQIVGGNDNLMHLDLSSDGTTMTKHTNAFCLRKVALSLV